MSNEKRKKTQQQNMTAIIYNKRNKILSIGKNNYVKTHPLMYKVSKEINPIEYPKKIYLHAEIDAIVKCENLKNAYRILVFRINAKGEYALAKPCPICEKAIREQTPIKIVEFSVDNDNNDFIKL